MSGYDVLPSSPSLVLSLSDWVFRVYTYGIKVQ